MPETKEYQLVRFVNSFEIREKNTSMPLKVIYRDFTRLPIEPFSSFKDRAEHIFNLFIAEKRNEKKHQTPTIVKTVII